MSDRKSPQPELDAKELAYQCVEICEDRKAEDVQLYDVGKASILADFYLVCTASSEPHLRAISGRVSHDLGERGMKPRSVEGKPGSGWTILDYGVVIVHIMNFETRDYYRLEELWETGELVYSSNEEASQRQAQNHEQ